MQRSPVLIVDDDGERRKALVARFQQQTRPVPVDRLEHALAVARTERPLVVCVARDLDGHAGLEAIAPIREVPGMDAAAFIVYGPGRSAEDTDPVDRYRVQRFYTLTHYLPGEVDVEDLFVVVWNELRLRRPVQNTYIEPVRRPYQVLTARNPTGTHPALAVPRVLERRSPMGLVTAAFREPVMFPWTTEEIRESELYARSWSWLLRSKATPNNLWMFLKRLGSVRVESMFGY